MKTMHPLIIENVENSEAIGSFCWIQMEDFISV